MLNPRSQLKVLLLQVRDDAATCLEELNEFVRYSGLKAEQFTVLNAFATPQFQAACIDPYDALFVGGSSDASVTQPDRYPFVKDIKNLLLHCLDESIPVFASCFGFQAVVEALGGQVIVDEPNMEMGTYIISLTAAAADDPLLGDLPQQFWAVSGHKERAIVLPETAILLARSDLCPYHALKMAEKPFYAFQFHPEIDPPDLASRITRYQHRYLKGEDALATVLQDLQNTSIANQLIRKFIDRIVLTQGRFKSSVSTL